MFGKSFIYFIMPWNRLLFTGFGIYVKIVTMTMS